MPQRLPEELFVRWRDAHDLAALAEVFDRTAPELLAVARHLVAREAEAEDLVQATFLAALEGAARFDAARPLVPWLVGILTHAARRVRRARSGDGELPERAAAAGDGPAARAEHAELRAALERALVHVPPAYREVVRMHLAEERSPEEIARSVARPKGTVRVQLHRGLAHLRRLLPAGFALGAGATLAPRGLADVRAHVLRVGCGGVLPVTAGVGAGGILMTKKVAAALAAIVLLGTALRLASRKENEPAPQPIVRADPLIAASSAAPSVVEAPASAESRREVGALPERAETTEPYGSLEVFVEWWDGAPAGGLDLRLVPYAERQPYQAFELATTDAEGVALVPRIRAGTVLVCTSGGVRPSWHTADVTAGSASTAYLVLERGCDVVGRVVDVRGAPVPGALLWVKPDLTEAGSLAAQADGDGAFRLRSLAEGSEIFATAGRRGCAPAVALESLTLVADGERSTEIRVRGEWSELVGTVRDERGEPFSGAQLLIHCANTLRDEEVERWPWLAIASDELGRFAADGLHPGATIVHVAGPGKALHVEQLTLEPGRTHTLDVRLGAGFVATGTVTLPDGRPAGAATVGLLQVGPEEDLHPLRTVADAAGRFELAHLPPDEEVVLIASSADGALQLQRRLRGAKGERVELDLVLGGGGALRGRALDEAGRPLASWVVRAHPGFDTLAASSPAVVTDALGRFEITGLVDDRYVVALYAPEDEQRAMPRAMLEHVQPGGEELELVARGEREPTAYVTGRVLAPGGEAVRAALGARRIDRLFSVNGEVWDDSDRFRLGPMLAGEYELSVDVPDAPWTRVPFTIGAGEELDLGDIAIPAPGGVRVSLRRSDGAPVGEPAIVSLQAELGRTGVQLQQVEPGIHGRGQVAPGTYQPRVTAPGVTLATVEPLEVRAGETTEVELLLVAGRTVLLDFAVDEGDALPAEVRVEVRDASGALRLEELRRLEDSQGHDRLSSLTSLPLGRATYTARAPDGREAQGTFDVVAAGDAMLHVPVRLARPR